MRLPHIRSAPPPCDKDYLVRCLPDQLQKCAEVELGARLEVSNGPVIHRVVVPGATGRWGAMVHYVDQDEAVRFAAVCHGSVIRIDFDTGEWSEVVLPDDAYRPAGTTDG